MTRNDHTPHGLTTANEDYLEAIYRITIESGAADGIRSVEVADCLGVSKASVNKAMTTLKEDGLVEQNRYGRVTLTEQGRAYGAEVWRCHRMIRSFLEHDLGVDPAIADEEACRMEHALSLDTMQRWMRYLAEQGLVIDEG